MSMSRIKAIDLLIFYKVIAPADRAMVPGTTTSIELACGGIDADKRTGKFKRADVLKLVGYHTLGNTEGTR